MKEVTAAELRVQGGFSTRAKEAMELVGTDFRDNMVTAKRELELMREAGLMVQSVEGKQVAREDGDEE